MLEIKNLSVEGKGHVKLLKGINFSVNLGQCVGLTGPSGAGKTTIIKTIMGVLDSTCSIISGDIFLDGVSLLAMTNTKRRNLCGTTLGFIPQNPMTAFYCQQRIGKLMGETFRLRLGVSRTDSYKLMEETLKKVNLPDVERILNSFASQLSGGMLQRITMAILWALKPKYIFADEPTSALDEENKYLLLELLQNYPEPCGIIFLSHDVEALKLICKQIMVLEKGHIVENSPTTELFAHPQTKWTKLFVKASKSFEGSEWEWKAS